MGFHRALAYWQVCVNIAGMSWAEVKAKGYRKTLLVCYKFALNFYKTWTNVLQDFIEWVWEYFYCKIYYFKLWNKRSLLQRSPKSTRAHTLKNNWQSWECIHCRVYTTPSAVYFMWPTHPAAPDGGESWMWGKRALSLPLQTHSLTLHTDCRLILIPIHLYARIC